MLSEFGRQLRKIRIDRDTSLKELSEILGVTSSYLSAIEHGKKNANKYFIEKIGEIFNLTKFKVDELVLYAFLSKRINMVNTSNLTPESSLKVYNYAKELEKLEYEK